MVDQAVIDFIKNQREEGVTDEEIYRALNVIGGWDKSDFQDALREIDGGDAPHQSPAPVENPFSTVTTTVSTSTEQTVGSAALDTKPFETTFSPQLEMSATTTTVTPVSASTGSLPLSPAQASKDHPTFAISLEQLSHNNKNPGYIAPQTLAEPAPAPQTMQFMNMGVSDIANPFADHAAVSEAAMNEQIHQAMPVAPVAPQDQAPTFAYIPLSQTPSQPQAFAFTPPTPPVPVVTVPTFEMPPSQSFGAPTLVQQQPPAPPVPPMQSYSAPMPSFATPTPVAPVQTIAETPKGKYQKLITFILFVILLIVGGYFFIQSQKGLANEVVNKLSFLNKKDKEILHDVAYSKLFTRYPGLTVKTNFTGTLTLKTPVKESFSMVLGIPIQELKDEEKVTYTAQRDLIKFGSTYHERSKGELTIGTTTIPFEMIVIDPVIYVRRVDGQSLGQTRGIEGAPSNVWFMIDPRHLDELQFDSVKMASFSGEAIPALFKKVLRQFDKQQELVNVAKSDANSQRLQFVYDEVLNTSISKFNFGNWVDEIFGKKFNPSLTKGFTDILFNQKMSHVDMGIDKETKDPITLSYRTSLVGSHILGDVLILQGDMNHVISSRLQGTGAVISEPGTPRSENDALFYQLFGSLGEEEGIVGDRINDTVQKLSTENAELPGDLVVDVIGAFTRNRQIDLDKQIESNLSKLVGLAKIYGKEKKSYAGVCDNNPGLKLIINDTKNMSDSIVCDDSEKGYRIVVQSVSEENLLYCINDESKKVQKINSPEESYTLNCKTNVQISDPNIIPEDTVAM